jgi:hypothetical protein
MKGLLCFVYKCPWDATNGGISSRCHQVTLVGLGPEGEIFEPTVEAPAVRLVRRRTSLSNRVYLHAEPVDKPEGMVGPMAGGNFIYTSDSRFPCDYPISLHDRFETQAQYNALSI